MSPRDAVALIIPAAAKWGTVITPTSHSPHPPHTCGLVPIDPLVAILGHGVVLAEGTVHQSVDKGRCKVLLGRVHIADRAEARVLQMGLVNVLRVLGLHNVQLHMYVRTHVYTHLHAHTHLGVGIHLHYLTVHVTLLTPPSTPNY